MIESSVTGHIPYHGIVDISPESWVGCFEH